VVGSFANDGRRGRSSTTASSFPSPGGQPCRATCAELAKEERAGQHQTGHNSGVIHSGIYSAPGSLEPGSAPNTRPERTASSRSHRRVRRGEASSAAPSPACCFEESLLVDADSELRRAMTLAESVGIEGASDLAKIRSANKD
jgi:hypothetical protein